MPVFWLYYSKEAWTLRTLLLDWFHPCFVLEVRNYIASKGLPFKVYLICTIPLATQNPMSSTLKALKWSSCLQTQHLIHSLDQGILRTLMAHYTWYSMEKIVSAMVEKDHGSLEGLYH